MSKSEDGKDRKLKAMSELRTRRFSKSGRHVVVLGLIRPA